MVFKHAIILYAIIALTKARPSSTEHTDTRMGNTPTQRSRSTTPTHINMDMDFEDASEYFRCTSCLTECTNLNIPLRYYLCQICIKNCTQRTDAFMFFFSSHKCKVDPQEHDDEKNRPNQVLGNLLFNERTTTMPPAHPSGINKASNRARPVSSPNSDYFDDYVNRKHFPNNDGNCARLQQKHDELQAKYDQCRKDLGNCNSGWPSETQSQYGSTGGDQYDSLDYEYPNANYQTDYPEETPDRERSSTPKIKQPEVTNYPQVDRTTLRRLEGTNPELAKLIKQNPIYLSNDTAQNKAANRNIINKFKAMFISKTEYDKLSKRSWSKDPEKIANIKSMGQNQHYKFEKETKIPVCPTRFKVASPMKVAHRSGSFDVEIMQDDEYVQPFIVAECLSKDPTVSVIEHATCDTVSVQRPAFMIVPVEQSNSFENCYEYDGERIVCKDWINLPGACSLFL